MWVRAGFVAAVVATLLIAVLSYRDQREEARQRTLILGTRAELESLGTILSAIEDAETAQRGYLLTGQEAFLGPYGGANQAIDKALSRLSSLEAQELAEPTQRSVIDDLRSAAAAKLAELDKTIQLYRAGSLELALEEVRSGRGLALMDRVRDDVASLREQEQRRLTEHQAKFLRSSRLGFAGTLGGALILLCLTGLTAWFVHREALRRQRVQAYREDLLSMVGHDLRNPLGVIRTAVELLLRQGELSGKPLELLQRVDRSAKSVEAIAALLVDLTYARLGGGIPLVTSETDLQELLRQATSAFALAHPEARFDVRCEGDPVGRWDPARLEQVFSNLLGNAVKYGDLSFPIAVEVRGTASEVRVRVANHGTPLSIELLPRVFEPFQRGEDATTQSRQGLGLGLFIVREIVTAHGGSVRAASGSGGGAEFTVELPRFVQPAPHGARATWRHRRSSTARA